MITNIILVAPKKVLRVAVSWFHAQGTQVRRRKISRAFTFTCIFHVMSTTEHLSTTLLIFATGGYIDKVATIGQLHMSSLRIHNLSAFLKRPTLNLTRICFFQPLAASERIPRRRKRRNTWVFAVVTIRTLWMHIILCSIRWSSGIIQ
jgi:hypothetical protein